MSIGNPDPISKKILRKKNTYDKTDTRALIGIEIIKRVYITRKAALIVNTTYKKADIIPLGNLL